MDYVDREKEKELIKYLDDQVEYKNVLLIEGARQVGKSRLVENVLKKRFEPVLKINLETDSVDLQKIDRCKDFDAFNDYVEDKFNLSTGQEFILYIDEAQESRMLGRFVRSMKERWKRGAVILTGSSMSRLFRPDVRYPVGRVSRIILRPFSFKEFLKSGKKSNLSEKINYPYNISDVRHENLLELCDEYLSIGGMPAVLAEYHGNKKDIREELLADIESDFIRLFDEKYLDLVFKSMTAVANIAGSPFKNTSVTGSSLSGRQNENINNIFRRLEDWHLVLKSDQNGPAPEKNYYPKRYFFDVGLLRFLCESSVPDLKVLKSLDEGSRTALGGVIENFTALELASSGYKFSGWKKTSTGTEIDFIIKSKGRAFPVECKASLKITNKNLIGLKNYFKFNDSSVGFIVSAAPFNEYKLEGGKRIINIPLYSVQSISRFIEE